MDWFLYNRDHRHERIKQPVKLVFSSPFKTLITITQSEPIQTSTMELFEKCLTAESRLTFDVRFLFLRKVHINLRYLRGF